MSKNKMIKELKEKYKDLLNNYINDLYQIFINQLINSNILGGLLILLINFIFGNKTKIIRDKFLNKFKIIECNIFEKKIFDNTTQFIICFTFNKNNENNTIYNLFEKDKIYQNINIDFTKYNDLLTNTKSNIIIKRYINENQKPSQKG